MRTDFDRGVRSAQLGMITNALLALVKLLAGVFGHSYALIADAVESSADIFSSLIVWGGLRIASRDPDDDYPFGYGKAETVASFTVALMLLGAAVGIAVEAIREIITPHHSPAPWTLIVLVSVVLVKTLLARKVGAVGEEVGSTAVKADAWHHRSDALTSLAAFIGISISLIGGKGYESADEWAALFACAVIAWNGYRLFRPAMDEVMDTAPPATTDEVRRIGGSIPGVEGIGKCRVRKYGTSHIVDIHVFVDGDMTVRRGHEIAHEVVDALRVSHLKVVDTIVHIEPSKR
jgi:cation diffusion facilitator family transporter